MRELHFLNSTVIKPIALMKTKKTREVFNTWFSFLQNNKKNPILFYNTYFQKNRKFLRIRTLSNRFSSQLVNDKKTLLPYSCMPFVPIPFAFVAHAHRARAWHLPMPIGHGHGHGTHGLLPFFVVVVPKGHNNNNQKGHAFQVKQSKPHEKNFPFFNRSFDKKRLKMLFSWYYANRGEAATFSLVETLQKLGFTYAMKAGISLGVDDLKVPPTKGELLTEAVELLANTKASVNSGNVTALEEFQQFVDTWHRTSENLKTSVVQNFSRSSSFLKKSNLNNLSSSGLEGKPGNTEKTKVPLLDLRSLKSREITPSRLNQVQPYRKENIFSSKTQEMRSKELALLTVSKNNINSYPKVNPSKEREKQLLLGMGNQLSSDKPELLCLESNVSVHKASQAGQQTQKVTASYSTILNPVYMMAFSGARGNLSQVRQLVGMRGLMADPQGQLVEFPIQSNFREGLTVTEYMISCYGARKGLVDTALRTAAAGYLTRRLVDVSHHQIVRSVTCGTKGGILLYNEHNKKDKNQDNLLPSAWKVPPYSKENSFQAKHGKQGTKQTPLLYKTSQTEEKAKKTPLVFCVGRVLARDIPGIAFRNQEIDISLASSPLLRKVYETIGIYIRSPLTCKSETGICQLCYGWSVSANRLVGLGEAVGIIAAQSIGEPGTQLTMRTFHTGGVFSGDIMEECRAKHAGVVFFQNVYLGLLVRTAGGAIAFCLKTSAVFQIKGASEITTYTVSANTLLFVRQGEKVSMDSLLAQIPNLPTVEESTGESTKTIVSDLSGEVRQKATVNPELASIRILAGQECKQFYFFNSFDMHARPNKYSPTPMHHKKQLIRTNSLTNMADPGVGLRIGLSSQYQVEKKKKYLDKGWKTSLQNENHLLAFQDSKKKEIKEYKQTKSVVNLICGAHRLGDNKTFSININGSNSEVVLPAQRAYASQKLSTSFQESVLYLGKDLNTNLPYPCSLHTLYWPTCPGALPSQSTATRSLSYLPLLPVPMAMPSGYGQMPCPYPCPMGTGRYLKAKGNEEQYQERHQEGRAFQAKHSNDLEQVGHAVDLENSVEQVTQATNIGNIQNGTRNLDYQAHWNVLNLGGFYKVNGHNFKKTALLRDLRFFVASKIHQNKFFAPLLFKNSTSFVLSKNFPMLSKVKLCMPSKPHKTSKFSRAMLVITIKKQEYKNQFKNSGFFQLLVYKAKPFQSQNGYSAIEMESNLTSTKTFLYYGNTLQKQIKPSSKFFSPYYIHLELFKLKKFFLDSKIPKQIQPRFSKACFVKASANSLYYRPSTDKLYTPYKELTLKLRDKEKTNGALKQISTLTVWPQLIPPKMVDYAYLFWKLEDLIFFRSNFTKKTQILSQLRISINKHWWGNKNSNYFVCNNIITKQSKGFELINFLNESKKTAIIKEFPNLLLKLLYRKKEKCLNTVEPLKHKRQNKNKALDFVFPMSCNEFVRESSKPRLKFQDSGEIFPLQGNTTLKEFQQKFRSLKSLTGLNSGLLIHYNRISYKIPLCSTYPNGTLPTYQTNNLISTKERLAFLRSELALFALQNFADPLVKKSKASSIRLSNESQGSQLWEKDNKQDLQKQSKLYSSMFSRTVIVKSPLVPQIGDFINTGDEVIKDCASAYCGQLIEKSPVGLTLRLTQNILYSNLRNRPAKINKSVKNGYWIAKGAPLVTLPYISNVTGDIVAGIPKIEQLFEARGEALDETVEKIWTATKLSIVPRSKAVRECFKEIGLFVVAAIQKVYSSQGVHIADKHLEVIIRQMTRRALIVDPGDTEFLPDEFVDLNTIECVNWATYGDTAIYRPQLIGITKASLTSNSFLSSASFQQTARVLERETILEKTDRLLGLKERVMMGALINAGTGELKTSVRLSDRSLAKSLSSKLFQRLGFFSRRKVEINKRN